MPAVKRTERQNEWWIDFRYRSRRIRRRSPVQTKRGAEQFERQLRSDFSEDEAHARDPFAGPPPTYAEFAERWMREYVEARNRPSAIREKRSYLRVHLLPAFGVTRLNHIDQCAIDSFISKKSATLAPKTVNNILTTLRCSLRVARDWGLVRSVPRIVQLRVPEQPFRYLSDEELSRLLSAAPSPCWRVFFLFLVRTGCRFGEAAGLSWEDVHLDETPCVRIHRAAAAGIIGPTKTGKARTVPLAPDIADALRAIRRSDGLVFPRPSGGPMRPDSTKDVLHRACDRAGIARLGWHTLRHTFATLLCARNVPISQIQRLLGHSTIVMTTRYAHVRQEDLHVWVNQVFGGNATDGDMVTRWSPSSGTWPTGPQGRDATVVDFGATQPKPGREARA